MQSANQPLNDAANTAVREFRAERDSAHERIDRVTGQVAAKAEHAFDRAAPAVDRAVKRGGDLAHAAVDKVAGGATRSASWVRENGERVSAKASVARERTAEYVREDPIKSVLMAAAAGALLYAITRALSGGRDH